MIIGYRLQGQVITVVSRWESERMKQILEPLYVEIKRCNHYKKNLGHNFHLCTIYGCAGDKKAPWWKRLLSHIYVIVRFRVIEYKVCVDYLSDEKKQELRERIAKENEHDGE